jgi:transcriptional regulator with XRE-family HTH domain
MTFKEIYNREKTKLTPCQNFIKEVAEVTRKSENTVRTWISGAIVPDELTKKVLSDYFNVPEDELFKKEE